MAKKKTPKSRRKKVSPKKATARSKPVGERATRVKPKEPQWLRTLRKRKEPLSLAIDEQGCIEFWKYSFVGPHDYNLMAWHPEGDFDFGFDASPSDDESGECPVSEWDNQYRPGHPIHDSLTPKERRQWGFIQGNCGGPASDGVMATRVTCSLDDLNEIIRRKKLPFVVVEDKRRIKPTASVFGTK
jgi:hypothetical protein